MTAGEWRPPRQSRGINGASRRPGQAVQNLERASQQVEVVIPGVNIAVVGTRVNNCQKKSTVERKFPSPRVAVCKINDMIMMYKI